MLRVLLLCVLVISVNSDERRRDGGRQGRFISFNVIEEDIRVDFAFNIPFLTIPVKKTMNSAYGLLDLPTVNINPASLALGGAIVLGTSVVIPFLLKSYVQDTNYRYARSKFFKNINDRYNL
ncbi:unnamed protein product [Chrysodeixis includens]|uniref:Uncharacterized protein n=1 Tax=Chrysodeixis includens TaxID=689277 RepID=A0A9P0BTG0_CHRIL|nr:unnamed protein product [Chrysodeixis includens]